MIHIPQSIFNISPTDISIYYYLRTTKYQNIMLRPEYLQPGDKIALIAPSGFTTENELETTMQLLTSWDLTPLPGKHILSRKGIFGGTIQERMEDYQNALNDEDTRAIWCMNGTYGALHLVEEADYSIFQGNPKWIIGMEDCTIIHAKLYTLGIESLYAFMPTHLKMTNPEIITQLHDFLFGTISSFSLPPHPFNRTGYAEAELIGGALEWVHNLNATTIGHHTKGNILFIEDQGGDLSRVDKAIRCLKYSGKLQHLQGLVIGQFTKNESYEIQEQIYQIIQAAVDEYDYPVCFGLPVGHGSSNYPLLLGTEVELIVRSTSCELRFT